MKLFIVRVGYAYLMASLVAQRLKCLPPMQETLVRSLGREDPLEKEMATHSSTLAWKIPWTEEPGSPQSTWSQRVGHNWTTSLSLSLMPIWESLLFVLRCTQDWPLSPWKNTELILIMILQIFWIIKLLKSWYH